MLQINLTARGYPKRMVRSAIDRAFQKDRSLLLDMYTQQNQRKSNLIPFITTYNPYNPPIDQILTSNKRILNACRDLKIIQDSKLIVVNRRALNLQDYLVRSDLNPANVAKGSGPCNTPCKTCPYMKKTTSIKCWITKEEIPIRGRYNCKSKNIIYLLSCAKCGLQYVGQSGNTFNERFRAHLTDVRQGNVIKPVSRHFVTNGHTVDDVYATILTQTSGNINIRLRTEESWITKLKTKTPLGLNLIQWKHTDVKPVTSFSPRQPLYDDTSWATTQNSPLNINVGIVTKPTPGKRM